MALLHSHISLLIFCRITNTCAGVQAGVQRPRGVGAAGRERRCAACIRGRERERRCVDVGVDGSESRRSRAQGVGVPGRRVSRSERRPGAEHECRGTYQPRTRSYPRDDAANRRLTYSAWASGLEGAPKSSLLHAIQHIQILEQQTRTAPTNARPLRTNAKQSEVNASSPLMLSRERWELLAAGWSRGSPRRAP